MSRSFETREGAFVAAVILLLTMAAGYSRVGSMGLLLDDWSHIGGLLLDREVSLGDVIMKRGVSSWEWRPLRAVELTLIFIAGSLGGVPAVFLLVGCVVALCGIVLARLVRHRVGAGGALVAGLALALFPPDTSLSWAIMLVGRLALLSVLLACGAFMRGRPVLATLLLFIGLTGYESSFFVFALVPWLLPRKDLGRSCVRGLIAAVTAMVAYVALRFFLFPTVDPKTEVFQVLGPWEMLSADAAAVVRIHGLALWEWPVQTVSLALESGGRGVAMIVGVLAAGVSWLWPWRSESPQSSATSWRFGLLLLWIAAIVPCGLAFIRPPTAELTTLSRANHFFGPGIVCLLVWIIQRALAMLPRGVVARASTAVVVGVVVGLLAGARARISEGYIQAAATQEETLRKMIADVGDVPPQTLIVMLEVPAMDADQHPFVLPLLPGLGWDTFHALRLIYDGSVAGIVSYHQSDIIRAWKEIEARDASWHPIPRSQIALWNVRTGAVVWKDGKPRFDGGRLRPEGLAATFLDR